MDRRPLTVVSAAGLALVSILGGCVSEQAYDDLQTANKSLSSRNAALAAETENSDSLMSSLRLQTQRQAETIENLRGENADLRNELDQARQGMAALEDRLGGLQLGGLDPVTGSALQRIADRYPSLSYDPARGVLRFASDFTFASGSAQVSAAASEPIAQLAEVLNSADAQGYDVIIVGHTDSQRPSAATQQRHPTNLHLSVHRSIAVRQQLQDRGVTPARMQAAGWGEYRPAVANTQTGNTPQNRRVEIFLVPATGDYSVSGAEQIDAVDQRGLQNDFDPIK
ncbi:MAG: OmpA family protein [Planctomycetota bacterium]